jgi:hypothetical protein
MELASQIAQLVTEVESLTVHGAMDKEQKIVQLVTEWADEVFMLVVKTDINL